MIFRLKMDRNLDMDNAGPIGIGAALGWWTVHQMGIVFALPPWLAQSGISLITMTAGAVLLHFVNRELKRRWPHEKKEEKDEEV